MRLVTALAGASHLCLAACSPAPQQQAAPVSAPTSPPGAEAETGRLSAPVSG